MGAEDVVLRYVGGGRFVAGVPARDLTAAEAEQYPDASASGLYERVKQSKPARGAADGEA